MSEIEEKKNLAKMESIIRTGSAEDITQTTFIDKTITIEELKKLDETLKAEIIFTRNGYGKKEKLETDRI